MNEPLWFTQFDRYYEFMSDYTAFFEETAENEKAKLGMLRTRNYDGFAELMSGYTLFMGKVEEWERKRLDLHIELGIVDKTLTGLAEECMEFAIEESEKLRTLHTKLSVAVANAQQFNDRALDYARMNIDLVKEIEDLGVNTPTYDQGGYKPDPLGGSSFINKKI
jgi:hypothetical protein